MQIRNVRFIIAAITTLGAYAVYVSRVNLSIAIIAMVEDGHQIQSQNESSSVPVKSVNGSAEQLMTVNGSSVSVDATPISLVASPTLGANTIFPTTKKSMMFPLISQEKFHWNQAEQGRILGAFFYGYILIQIPGARIAELVGAKWILLTGIFSSAVISLVFPLSTQLNSLYLLMLLRFLMGICQSAFFPAAYVLFCRWFPERERAVLLPIMFIGSNIGSISTYIMSSYLISSSYGWPSVFYVSGLICLFVSLLWVSIVSSEPADNWLITDEERFFIEGSVTNQSSEINSLSEQPIGLLDEKGNKFQEVQLHKNAPISPQLSWPKLLRSMPVWTLVFSMYGNEWSNVVICILLPTYLNSALRFPIEQNGVINSFFQLSFAIASPIMSSLGAFILDRHLLGMRKIHVRKLFQSLATFGQMCCFISVPICGDDKGLIIMFMFAAIVFKSCANAGDIMVSGDLSPEYAGTLFAFANSIGNTAGVFVPLLAGVFVRDSLEREQWTPFWLTTAAIMGLSGLIFLVLGVTRRQDFAPDSMISIADDVDDDDASDDLSERVNCGQVRLKSSNKSLVGLRRLVVIPNALDFTEAKVH